MNKSQRWIAGGAVLAVLIVIAGWFLVVSPVRSKTSTTKSATADLVTQNNTLQSQLDQLVAQNKGVTAKQAALANVAAEVPSDPHLPQLIRTLTASASDSGVDLVTLTPTAPSSPTGGTGAVTVSGAAAAPGATATTGTTPVAAAAPASAASYETIPVALTLNGDYSAIEEFVQHLQTMKRIFVVNSLTLAPDGGPSGSSAAQLTPGGQPQTAHTLTVTLSGSVFMTDADTTSISLPALDGTTSTTTSTTP